MTDLEQQIVTAEGHVSMALEALGRGDRQAVADALVDAFDQIAEAVEDLRAEGFSVL